MSEANLMIGYLALCVVVIAITFPCFAVWQLTRRDVLSIKVVGASMTLLGAISSWLVIATMFKPFVEVML